MTGHMKLFSPVYLAVLGLWCASAYFNFLFGLKQGLIYALCYVCSDVIKANCLTWFSGCRNNKNLIAALACLALFAICTLFSLLSAFGAYSDMKDKAQSSDVALKTAYEQTMAEQQDLKRQLEQLGSIRPVGTIEAEMSGARTQKRWVTTQGCVPEHITVDPSREFCKAYAVLAAELETSKRADQIRLKLEQVEHNLKHFDLQKVKQATDAQAQNLSVLTGLTVSQMIIVMTVGFAILTELTSAFGFWLMRVAGDLETESAQKFQDRQEHIDSVYDDTNDQYGLQRFLSDEGEYLKKASNGQVKARDFFAAYTNWSQRQSVSSRLNRSAFGVALTHYGFKRGRLSKALDKRKPVVYCWPEEAV